MIVDLIARLMKKTLYKIRQYFPEPYNFFGRNVKVELDLPNYATKVDLKNATGTDTSNLAAKSDLATLESEIDKINVEKSKTVLVDSRKLSSLVNNEVVKKTVFDKLAAKVNIIDTSGFILKTKYGRDKSNLKKKSVVQTN